MATPALSLAAGSPTEWQDGYNKFKEVRYKAGPYSTLSGLSLELGNNLPIDSAYEIVSTRIEFARNGDRVIVVRGVDEVTDASGSVWSELRGTRRLVTDTVQYQEWEVRYTAATSGTPPALGTTVNATGGGTAFGATGLDEEPEAVNVTVLKKVTPTKDHCVVRYRAYYEAIAAASASYWDELRGTRRMTADAARHRQWELRFSAAADTTLPTNGSELADVTGDATDLLVADPVAAGLAREPIIVNVSYAQKVVVNKDHIVVQFRAYKTRGANPTVN